MELQVVREKKAAAEKQIADILKALEVEIELTVADLNVMRSSIVKGFYEPEIVSVEIKINLGL